MSSIAVNPEIHYEMFSVRALLLFLLIGAIRGDVKLLNEEIDSVLDNAREEILRNGNDRLRVADFGDSFTYKYFLLKVESELHCTGGYMGDISTLRRIGDVVIGKVDITERSDLVKLTVPLRLSHFDVRFENCRLAMSKFARETDKADFHFPRNVLQLSLTLEGESDKCQTKIAGIELNHAERIGVDTDNHLMKFTDYWVREIVEDYINLSLKTVVINQIEKIISHYLKVSNLCELIKK